MKIRVARGPIEGIVTYDLHCLIAYGGKVCACLTSGGFYELDADRGLAYPTGAATKLLATRIASGDEFVYRKKQYRKLTAAEAVRYIDRTYGHVMPIGPEALNHLWFY